MGLTALSRQSGVHTLRASRRGDSPERPKTTSTGTPGSLSSSVIDRRDRRVSSRIDEVRRRWEPPSSNAVACGETRSGDGDRGVPPLDGP